MIIGQLVYARLSVAHSTGDVLSVCVPEAADLRKLELSDMYWSILLLAKEVLLNPKYSEMVKERELSGYDGNDGGHSLQIKEDDDDDDDCDTGASHV